MLELDSRQILTSPLCQNSFQPEKTSALDGLRKTEEVKLVMSGRHTVRVFHSFEKNVFLPSAWPLFPGLCSSHSHILVNQFSSA